MLVAAVSCLDGAHARCLTARSRKETTAHHAAMALGGAFLGLHLLVSSVSTPHNNSRRSLQTHTGIDMDMPSMRLPFVSKVDDLACELLVPPSAYPSQLVDPTDPGYDKVKSSQITPRYGEIMQDMRALLDMGPEETPTFQIFKRYCREKSPMVSSAITNAGGAQDGEELWIRIYNVFLHHAVAWPYGRTWLPECCESCGLCSFGPTAEVEHNCEGHALPRDATSGPAAGTCSISGSCTHTTLQDVYCDKRWCHGPSMHFESSWPDCRDEIAIPFPNALAEWCYPWPLCTGHNTEIRATNTNDRGGGSIMTPVLAGLVGAFAGFRLRDYCKRRRGKKYKRLPIQVSQLIKLRRWHLADVMFDFAHGRVHCRALISLRTLQTASNWRMSLQVDVWTASSSTNNVAQVRTYQYMCTGVCLFTSSTRRSIASSLVLQLYG